MEVYKIIKRLESNNYSRTFKIQVLMENIDNEDLKQFFVLCLDKSINFYIKKIPKFNQQHKNEITLSVAMERLGKLSKRVFTGKKGIFFLSKLLTECSWQNADLIQRIIKKDPGCRVSFGTVNKAWPKLVEKWPCHLCERSTEKNLANIVYPAYIQEKSDGMRINIIYKDDDIYFRSRNGKHIQTHGKLDSDIRKIADVYGKNFVLDGEALILKEGYNTETNNIFWLSETNMLENRQTGNGIMNKSIQNTITEEDADRIVVNLWDIIDYDDFENKKGIVPYTEKINCLRDIFKRNLFKKFGIINTKIVKDIEHALRFYKLMLSKEKEGAIIKNMNCIWEDRRSKDTVKLKINERIDMKIVDTYPHKKKPKWIGGLTLESSDSRVRVNCGSGLKDVDRKKNPIEYLNKIVTIESNGIIKSKDSKDETKSLFLPTFKGIRHDKDVADSYQDIKNIFNSFLIKEK